MPGALRERLRARRAEPWRSRRGSSTAETALIAFAVCFGLGAGAVFLGRRPASGERVEQPIAFDHRKHVQDEGMECIACHAHYATDASSGLPAAEACALCHLEAQGESAEEKKLVEMLGRGARLDWQPLFQQPTHVFYSHRRHVAVAGIECRTCHGSIGESVRPPERAEPLSMEACLACHREQGASTDCTACHR